MKVCSVEGCDNPSRSKGLCANHYQKARNQAKSSGPPKPKKQPLPNAPVTAKRPKKDNSVSTIANTLDRFYLKSTFQKLNTLEEVKLKVKTDFSDTDYIPNLGDSFCVQVNSIPEDDFNRLCDSGQFPKEVERLYLCLTNQAQPDVYMLAKCKFKKKSKNKKPERMSRVEIEIPKEVPKEPEIKPEPRPIRKKVVKKELPDTGEKRPRGRPKQSKDSDEIRDEFGFRSGTTSSTIAGLIAKNRFTIHEIADRVMKDVSFVHVIISKIKKTKQWNVFDEIRNNRKVIACERKV
jgi:hypothetical protein